MTLEQVYLFYCMLLYTLYGFAITNNVMYMPKTIEKIKMDVKIFFTTK